MGMQRAIGACNDGTLGLWDLEEMEQLAYCDGIPGLDPRAVSADFAAKRAVASDSQGKLHLVDLETMRTIGALQGQGITQVVKADFASMCALNGSTDSNLRVWDLSAM